ncbi:hypothetical protein MMC10_006913 [Thelotrema lepadinum]|nr:hypothetical protein [Thelotrema lepadinum]
MASSATSPKLRVLVTGATGNQGGAVIDAFVNSPEIQSLEIVALTRNVNSPKAQSIAAKSKSIVLLSGDLSNCEAMFNAASRPINAVFSVQTDVYGSHEKIAQGEIQGRALIDAAVKNGVGHFVQASGDRGGSQNSDVDPTSVPQFITKFVVENHLKQQTAMTWTILRPSSFMENCHSGLHGQGFAAMWSCMGDKPLQVVSTKDIGIFATKAILESSSPVFKNRAISLAGDELTYSQAASMFKEDRGKTMPKAPALVGTLVQWNTPELKSMFDWFKTVGFKANIEECRRIHPAMLDFRAWLKETDNYKR